MRKAIEPGERLRGRAGMAARARRLKAHPFCVECARDGIQRLTDEIDHVHSLALGGTDTDDNVQGLCSFHHAVKTAVEGASAAGAATHPEWLLPARVPLTIVVGPPCGGKSTYVKAHAEPGDCIIDLDEIAAVLSPGWDGRWNKALLDHAMRSRNAMLGGLHRMRKKRAWFIVSAPTTAERDWWLGKLGGSVLVCNPGIRVCIERAQSRDGRTDHVVRWFRAQNRPWHLPRARVARNAIGADGFPIEGQG